MTGSYRSDIDGLRAVAVTLVVAYHAGVPVLSGGYVGVDVFFVLSGFLITGILLDELTTTGSVSLRRFWSRRARRLLPMASLVLVVTLFAGYWTVNPVHRLSLISDLRAAALYIANWRFADQAVAYSDTSVTESLVLHYWSLSIEEQFYVAWPLLLVLAGAAARRFGWGVDRVVFVIAAVVAGASFTLSVLAVRSEGSGAYFLTRTRVWEFAAGALLAGVVRHPRHRALKRRVQFAKVSGTIGAALIVVAAGSYDADTPFPGLPALMPVVGTLALVWAGSLAARTPLTQFLSMAPMTAVGRWSYSIYLWHWPLIGLAAIVDEHWSIGLPYWLRTATAVAVSVLLAALSHRYVENPIRHARSLATRPIANAVLGVSLMAGIIGTSAIAVAATGPVRLPDSFQTIEQALQDDESLIPEVCFHSAGDPRCLLGDPTGDFVVVLIGDSHARHFAPALTVIAERRGWQLNTWTLGACAPFDLTLYNGRTGLANDACSNWYESMVRGVQDLDDIDLVIVGRSSGYDGNLLDEDMERITDAEIQASTWAEGVTSTFSMLAEHTETIIVMRDTPGFREPTFVECLAQGHESPLEACARDLGDGSRPDDWIIEAERLARFPETVTMIDPYHLVCPTNPCLPVSAGGAIKLRDGHHMTQTFVLEIADDLEKLIDGALE